MKPKSDTKVSYNTCDRCKEKVATLYWNKIERRWLCNWHFLHSHLLSTLYWNKIERRWLCKKCQFRDRTKESIIAPNAQKGV